MLKDFKDFILKGNVVDMAVGVMIAGAFGLVVKSLIDNVVMPLIAAFVSIPDFSNLFYVRGETQYATLAAAEEAGAAVVRYGIFINDFINLLVIGLVLFIAIKVVMGAIVKSEEEAEEEVPRQEAFLEEIRDLLKR